jgi:UDP-N-acetylglucosamine 2-epimerase (non-hydrolysing)
MADTLLHLLPQARARPLPEGLAAGGYGVLTLHRAENVDDPARLAAWLEAVGQAASLLPLAWPQHPRTRLRMEAFGMTPPPGVRMLPPLGYLDFAALLAGARLVATDSGGVQEEATVLDLPCLTLRDSTERPVTLQSGSSRLIRPEAMVPALREVLAGTWPHAGPLPLWDREVGRRIRDHLAELLG